MGRQDWRTPPSVFEALSQRWGPFDVDAAADVDNALCETWLSDGIREDWGERTWVNPPFSDIMPWVKRAAFHEGRTVMLTPSNTSSPWFRKAIGSAVLYLPNRRIRFWHPGESPGSPDHDTVIWVFGDDERNEVFEIEIPEHGKEVRRLWEEANGQQSLICQEPHARGVLL